MKKLDKPVPPGGTIGIIGGGQLGRMLALAVWTGLFAVRPRLALAIWRER